MSEPHAAFGAALCRIIWPSSAPGSDVVRFIAVSGAGVDRNGTSHLMGGRHVLDEPAAARILHADLGAASRDGLGLRTLVVYVWRDAGYERSAVVDGWQVIRECGLPLDMSGADLARADLRGARLRRANLTGADLCGADVSRSDLSGAELGNATFERARAFAVNFRNVRGDMVDFRRSDLGAADMKGAVLRRCSFEGANLKSVFVEDAAFEDCHFAPATLQGATP